MLPSHVKITRVALAAAGRFGFALAGGYAVSAHGMGSRLSGDVDLFTSWHLRASFPEAVDNVINALEEHRYTVTALIRSETFVRLLIAGQDDPGAEPDKLEMSADWRAHDPVMSAVGPVLHPDDAVANKMCALFGRAEARDFLDVDAALMSGRYTKQRLLELAAAADPGFEPHAFADALGALTQITDADFDCYGIPAAELPAVRDRFARWRRELTDTP
ncbi:nucleotidyl transferase AbiEii/AbiGii toxin family protein [Verrucosispora sioxanthis]|uniref:Nucleotidyl transferase AbiEii/AbiGii toxin family protein n=1 Tax=Verrucosispora sioxanthis TaxID=2499994 RepID=A0A6M1KQG7_9ACTN|nr:nucleotidyl transferase AbiEii/AbiGii toxin family protein [Verrucosispora sioxanthis]NEE63058.1 nucleotidyl transferase AbiEii/AbiGii toxin family protein [Verrucosispora sioxanthis]NGM12168.1 nucleotidyl transferase AbiEii/AbiGii toxin family protein [Verrucosispora sioxanthis]